MTENNKPEIPVLTLNPTSMAKDKAELDTAAAQLESAGAPSAHNVAEVAGEAAAQLDTSMLTEEELAVYKRGRNTRVNSVPKNANRAQYHAATGLESLFGWLYLRGEHERLGELFAKMMEGE